MRQRCILTPIAFNEVFEENVRNFNIPAIKAYEITEKQHENQFGGRRYSSFKSFSNSRKSFLKK